MGVNRKHGGGTGGGAGGGARRAWYPSGPWVDDQGRYVAAPASLTFAAPSRASASPPVPPAPEPANPDPDNYTIEDVETIGVHTILVVRYHGCVNYEGVKILVYDRSPAELLKQKTLDPHFFEAKDVASPVARFVPSGKGREMARLFCKAMLGADAGMAPAIG